MAKILKDGKFVEYGMADIGMDTFYVVFQTDEWDEYVWVLYIKYTEEALKNPLGWSIKKWEFILKWLTEEGVFIHEDGGNTCALCISCYPKGDFYCDSCVVNTDGEHTYCTDTPFIDYDCGNSVSGNIEIAEEEIAFLKSLRK